MNTAISTSRLASIILFVLIALAVVLAPQAGHAASGTWTNIVSGGLWSASANWTNGIVADGSGNTADFSSVNITTDPTVVQLDSARTIGNLTFGDTTTNSAASWSLSNNGTAANVLTLGGAAPTITVNTLAPGKLATISAGLSGTAGFTKAGPTSLVLTGTNTVTGVISNTAGQLRLSNARALGDGVNNAAGLVIGGSGILDFAGVTPLPNVPLTLNSTANGFDVGAIQNSTSATTNIYGGTVTLLRQTRFGGVGVMQFTNTITGNTNNFIKDSTGRLDLRNSGLVELGTLTGNRGTVQVEAGTILNVTNINIGSGGNVGAGLTLNGGSVTNLGNTRFGTGTGTASGTLNLNSGTLTVTNLAKGGVTFNINFNGATLIAAASQTVFMPAATSAKVQAGNAIIDDGGNAITIGVALVADVASPGGGLLKRGSGTLTLTGNNTYTGSTVVNAGTLALSGSGAIASSTNIALTAGTTLDVAGLGSTFTVAANQVLSGYGTVNGNVTDVANAQITPGGSGSIGTLSFANDLTLAGGDTLNFDFSSGGSNDLITVAGTVTPNGVTTINLANWPLTNGFLVGTNILLEAGSLAGGVGNFALSHLPGRQSISLAYDTSGAPHKLLLVVSSVPGSAANLVWQGGLGGNAWDVQTTANWLNGVSSDIFYQSDSVLFSNVPPANVTLDLAQTVSPASIVINSTNDYVLASASGGFITGPTALVKNGSGTLTLSQTNNYSGGTLISGGTLQLGDGALNNGLLSGNITNNATLAVANPQDETLPNIITGSGQVVKSAAGTLTLSGANSFAGGLSVNGGAVNVANASALGSPAGAAANIAGGATLRFDNASAQTQPGALTGAGAIVKANQNALTLNQPNSFSGGLTINLGAVYVGDNNALGAGPVTIDNLAAGATVYAQLFLKNGVTITNPIIIANGASFFQGLLMVDAGAYGYGGANGSGGGGDTNSATFAGPITLAPGLIQRGGLFTGPFNGNSWLFINGPVTNSGGSVGSRNGRVRFSGGGDYATLSVSEGRVSIGANNGVSTNATLSLAGIGAATFDLNGFNQTLAGLTAGVGAAQITNSSATASTLTLNLSSAATFTGPVGGKLNLVVNGAGSLNLATNLYTGNTTVNGGTLQLAQATLATASTVTVSNGAVLQLDFATTNQVGSFVTNGVVAGPGLYNSTTAAPFITGSGSLLVGSPVATYPTNITTSVSGSLLTLTWPETHLGWYAQSNSVSVADPNYWFDISNSQLGTNLVINISPAQTNVFFRLRNP